MRPSPAGPVGRVAGPLLALLLVVGACDGRTPTGVGDVRRIGLDAPSVEMRPGSSMLVHASPLDADDAPVNVPVVWTSLTPAILNVSPLGVVEALAPGTGVVRATAGAVFADLTITLVNPPAAALTLGVADTVTLLLPGGPALALSALATDAGGLPIIGATLLWQTSADRIATVSATGQVTALAVGFATVRVALDGRADSVVFAVSAEATATAPVIQSVLPSLMQPGVPVVLQGERFAPTAAGNVVHVDGVAVTVTAASATELTVVLPTSNVPCLPTRSVALQVATSDGIGVAEIVLQVAPRLTLAAGEAFVVTTAAAGACQEIEVDDGEYLVSLTHSGTALGGGPIGLTLRGRIPAGATTGALVAGSPAPALRGPETELVRPGVRRGPSRRVRAHHDQLRASREALVAARPEFGAPFAAARADASLSLPAPGGIVTVRVPDLDSPTFCGNFNAVGARTVFAGAHVVILEDTATTISGAPTTAGAIDPLIVALGEEVESAVWPLLLQFGNPLVMDSRLDANGRIAILLTPRMNAMRAGDVLGAVVTCDFFPRAQVPSSNVGEILYLQVPTSLDAGLGAGTPERWRWEIRSVVAHELKHVVSFAERIVRGQPLEELWLEEATARHAEELFARTFYAAAQRGDATYDATLRCEAREAGLPAGCSDVPRVMRSHLEGLYEFLDAPTLRSPLGGSDPADASFYGSAWALTRWALDQSAQGEAALLAALTTSGQSGVANLEARIGLPWDVVVSLWALAMLSDGMAGLTPSSPQLEFPSWDLTDLFAGLCTDVGPCAGGGTNDGLFGRAHPARPVARTTGDFDLTFPEIAPGGFAAVRLSGTVSTGRQLLELRGAAGALPPTARLSVLRVR